MCERRMNASCFLKFPSYIRKRKSKKERREGEKHRERVKENDLFTPACPLEEDDRNLSLGQDDTS
jgi:hypothetical protein